MLYRLHNNILIIGLLTIGFLIVLSASRAFCAITIFTLIAFISQLSLLMRYSSEESGYYSEKELFLVVLIYGLLLAILIFIISGVFYGEEFVWEDPDGVFYHYEGMKSADMGFVENAKRITTKYGADDWAALLLSALMMSIIPSSFFMNTFHVLTGAISAIMLFRIGQQMMPKQYAYLAALAYGTSSYLIMFHCTYLKESVFTFFVIAAMYFFYWYVINSSYNSLLLIVVCLLIVTFYRPAVTAFLVMAFGCYYAVAKRGSAISLFLYIAITIGLVVSMTFIQGQVEHYTEGGNTDALLAENGSANYSGGFNFFMGWFVSLFGPFPTLFPNVSQGPRTLNFYGAGLTYKLFLVIPLWTGVFYAIKRFKVLLIPLLTFTLVEMAASAYIMASFELRKVMLHMPFIYILGFYGFHQIETNNWSENFRKFMELAGSVFVIGVLFLWNVIKVKG